MSVIWGLFSSLYQFEKITLVGNKAISMTSMVEFWEEESIGSIILEKQFFYLTFPIVQTGHQKLGIILDNKVLQKFKLSNNDNSNFFFSKLIGTKRGPS